jgi:hypothetical protein
MFFPPFCVFFYHTKNPGPEQVFFRLPPLYQNFQKRRYIAKTSAF